MLRLFLLLLGFACTGSIAQPQTQEALLRALPHLEYLVEFGKERVFPLNDGRLSLPAERIEVRLLEQRALGDLNGDGWPDAAVTLVVDGGGSGRFIYLAAVLNRFPKPEVLPAVLLGDRVPVEAIDIRKDAVRVRLCERAADAPMSSRDCKPVERDYGLIDGRLVSLQAAAAARTACLTVARDARMQAPRVAAERYVGGPIWVLRIEGRQGDGRTCAYDVVTKQARLQ